MSRPACPPWCGGAHHCTAQLAYPGEHRSAPMTIRQPWGVMVISRVARTGVNGQQGRLEIRLQVMLAAAEIVARDQAEQIANGIRKAVGAALIDAVPWDAREPHMPALMSHEPPFGQRTGGRPAKT